MDHINAGIACRPRPAPLARAVVRLGNDRIAALEQLLEMSRGLGRAHVARCRDRLHLSSDPAARRQLIAEIESHTRIVELAEQLLQEAANTDRRLRLIDGPANDRGAGPRGAA